MSLKDGETTESVVSPSPKALTGPVGQWAASSQLLPSPIETSSGTLRSTAPLIADDTTRDALLAAVRDAGFKHATIDLAGIQSGAFTLQILSSRPEVA